MIIPRPPHRWNVTPKQAIAIQRRLANRVQIAPLPAGIRFVAGVDAAFSSDERECIAGVVLWDRLRDAIVEQHVVWRELTFPYVPGLLSFREAPAVIAALRQLRTRPEALMVDGQGIAHPRRFGIAAHIGVMTDLPTVGCAKSRLCGEHDEPRHRRGASAPLLHDGELIGCVLRTQDRMRPLFVSVAHRSDLPTAEQLVLASATRFRLPEPTRLADRLVAAAKRGR